MVTKTNIKNVQFWSDELNTALIYDALAEIERDPRIAGLYTRMAAVERKHAEHWEEMIRGAGDKIPPFKVTWRTKSLIWLARRFGAEMILPNLQAMEKDGNQGYLKAGGSGPMALDEQSHAIFLSHIKRTVRGGMEGSVLAKIEGRHRSAGGNALRAAVLGANDGLVSNLSLVMGVAGASMNNQAILIAGLAGLLAGAFSMALGEWLSVQSSRELFEHQIKIEEEEIEQTPGEEAEELALIYEARGLEKEQALSLAKQIMSNKTNALDTLAREELGVDPDGLGGSAWVAAVTSFVLFAIGALIPVFPYLFLSGNTAILTSIGGSLVGLFLLGAAITLFTGKSVWYSGLRMVVFGSVAAAITFGIGRLIGVSLA